LKQTALLNFSQDTHRQLILKNHEKHKLIASNQAYRSLQASKVAGVSAKLTSGNAVTRGLTSTESSVAMIAYAKTKTRAPRYKSKTKAETIDFHSEGQPPLASQREPQLN
jgi:hypothetical protein